MQHAIPMGFTPTNLLALIDALCVELATPLPLSRTTHKKNRRPHQQDFGRRVTKKMAWSQALIEAQAKLHAAEVANPEFWKS